MAKILEIPHSEIIGKTLMLLTQTSRLINKYIDAYFYQKTTISFTKYMALKVLASGNGVLTPSQLAEWTQTELHNITTLVSRLKKDGLVFTNRSDIDNRKVNVILTDNGRKLLSEATPVALELINIIMSSISKTDAVKLSKMLEVLRDNAYNGLGSIKKA